MTKIKMLHKAMQELNKAHKEAKGEVYDIISALIKENSDLQARIKVLESRGGRAIASGQLTLADFEPTLSVEVDKEQEETDETVTLKVDFEKQKAQQEESEKVSLTQALVAKQLIQDEDPTGENHLFHEETVNRLAEVLGITDKEGTAPNRYPVLLVAKDSTGSMGIWESYMARCVAHWAKEMLNVHYGKFVDARYITFNALNREEVTEEDCFTSGCDGGTLLSPTIKMLNMISDDYNYEEKHDIYVLILSDGDNMTTDGAPMVRQLDRLAPKTKKSWYVEMNQYNRHSTILAALKPKEDSSVPTPVQSHVIATKEKVFPTLFEMFQEVE